MREQTNSRIGISPFRQAHCADHGLMQSSAAIYFTMSNSTLHASSILPVLPCTALTIPV
jgi:hypothetical protein